MATPFESSLFESSTDCGAASLCFAPWETPASSMARIDLAITS